MSARIAFSNGDGTFGTSIAQPQFPLRCDDYTHDFDGDGWPDVLCYDAHLGNAAAWAITADDATISIFTVSAPTAPRVSDLNNDGLPDLVYGIGSSVGVALATGRGQFAGINVVLSAPMPVGTVSFADIDGDGFTDIVAEYGTNSGRRYAPSLPQSQRRWLRAVEHARRERRGVPIRRRLR